MSGQHADEAAGAASVSCPHWQSLLDQQLGEDYFSQLISKVAAARRQTHVYPPADQVFEAFKCTPWAQVKVVVLGQDPYHQPGQAHGLAFSVPADVKVPPSLRNMYKALAYDDEDFVAPQHGDLRSWAQQGVLLLNTVLTVEEGKAHAHAKLGWEHFTDAVMTALNQHPQPLVFLLWGKHAQAKGQFITDPRHLKLTSVHPSPLSAHRGFLTCGHFATANQFLREHQRPPINWRSVCDAPDARGTDAQTQQRQQKLAF
ncbi:MAG: uracil-DNA glycosylase [Idiomarina sp.]|nr:uracil-DNA glycosylase [Idiomarina sp.]